MKRYSVRKSIEEPVQWESYHFPSLFLARFEKGEYLFLEGQPVENLFLIESGIVKGCISGPEGKNLLINFYSKGRILGDVETILNQSEAIASVQAITKVICYAVPGEEFMKTAHQNPALMNDIAVLLAERAKRNVRNAAVTILSDLEMRLCAYIEQTQKDGVFKDNLSNLSDLLGTSYQHLHRTLRTLCQKGILLKTGHIYQITDMEALSVAARGMYRI